MKLNGIILASALALLVIAGGCKKEEGGNVTASSSHNGTGSKNMSGVCQNCHISGGSGRGWWTSAGTVYNQELSAVSANGTVYLYSGPDGTGTILATIEVDAYGNFYTSATAFPSSGCYPQVRGASGNIRNMPQLCTSGNCNSCHGVTETKIWIN